MVFYIVASTFTPGVVLVAANIFRPNNCDVVIGDGRSGAKSTTLQKYKPLIEKVPDLSYEPHVAVAPSVYKGHLKHIGASHENPKALEVIDKTDFNKEVLDAHNELRSRLKPNVYYALRSDECHAGGNGLWKGTFIRLSRQTENDLKIINNAAKIVLKSEFSDNAVAFKKRMGLAMEEMPGVFAMEVVAKDISEWLVPPIKPESSGGQNESILFTPFHFNAISAYNGNNNVVLLAGSAGIGGASIPWFTSVFSIDSEGSAHPIGKISLEPKGRSLVLYENQLSDLYEVSEMLNKGREGYLAARNALKRVSWLFEDVLLRATRALAKFAELAKETNLANEAIYMELAGDISRSFSVLQCAPARQHKAIPKPDMPQESRIMEVKGQSFFGQRVCGNMLADTEQVVYLPKNSLPKDLRSLNSEARDYVLITEMEHLCFDRRVLLGVKFADYSNAREIIFSSGKQGEYEIMGNLTSHLGGALREAGIAVIEGEVDEKFLEKLKPGINNIKLTSYVDEFAGEAFVAER